MATWQFVLIGIAVMFVILAIFSYVKNYKKLGACLIPARKGFKYTDKKQWIIVVILLALFVTTFFNTDNAEELIPYAYSDGIVVVVFILYIVITASFPKGLYEHGVATNSSVLGYGDIEKYVYYVNSKAKTVEFVFNGTGKFFSSAASVIVEEKDAQEVKSILKKNARFKKR